MGIKYRHPDDQTHLDWLAFIGKNFPEELRDLAEEYCAFDCYRIGQAHVWIQRFDFGGTYGNPKLYADVLQGADSRYPGITIKHVDVHKLEHCGCGRFVPPTKEAGEAAQRRYENAVMHMKKVLN